MHRHPELRPLSPYPDPAHRTANQSIARGLGSFGIALGVAELLFGPAIARGLGMPGKGWLIRACGVREIATGLGILGARSDTTPWLWGRVAGDAMDLAALAAHSGNPHGAARGVASVAVAGVTALDVMSARIAQSRAQRARMPVVDYSDRSGFPQGVEAARGAARDAAQQPPAALSRQREAIAATPMH